MPGKQAGRSDLFHYPRGACDQSTQRSRNEGLLPISSKFGFPNLRMTVPNSRKLQPSTQIEGRAKAGASARACAAKPSPWSTPIPSSNCRREHEATSPPDLKKHIPLRRFDSPIANLPLRGSSGDFFAMLSNQAAGIFAAHHPLDVDAVHRLLDSGQESPSPRARPLPGRSQPAKNPRSCHNAPTRLPVSPPRHHKLRNCPAPSPSRESNSSSTVSQTPA